MIKEKMKGSEGITVVKNGITYYAKPENFHSKIGVEYNKEDIWCSYDDNGNFHIVPDKNVKNGEKTLTQVLEEKLELIGIALPWPKYSSKSMDNLKWHFFKGNAKFHCTDNHQLIFLNDGDYQYLLSFNRLWCGSDNHIHNIHNNFGQVQFMRYPKEKQINFTKDKRFVVMYPNSGKDYDKKYDLEYSTGRLSYNAPFTINDCPKRIANAFIKFVILGEQAKNNNEEVQAIPGKMKTHCEKMICNLPDPTAPTT